MPLDLNLGSSACSHRPSYWAQASGDLALQPRAGLAAVLPAPVSEVVVVSADSLPAEPQRVVGLARCQMLHASSWEAIRLKTTGFKPRWMTQGLARVARHVTGCR